MRLIIDTNVILDVLAKREPFYTDSQKVLSLCENRIIEGFISAASVTDLFYLLHKHTHDNNRTYDAIGHLMNIVRILTVTNTDITEAFLLRAADFEDCLLSVCAQKNNCKGIVTRNKKDFIPYYKNLYSPEEIIALSAE